MKIYLILERQTRKKRLAALRLMIIDLTIGAFKRKKNSNAKLKV